MKKILGKSVLLLIAVLLAVQVPFIYRRYKIGRLSDRIASLNADRATRETPGYTEYKGVMHAHTSLGGHSTGTFDELIEAANDNGLDFVAMTEHYDLNYDASTLGLNGVYGKTLFINGQEVDSSDGGRYLLFPGSPESASFGKLDSKALMEKIHAEGRLAVNNYPERKTSDNTDFDGMEVYSLHINAKKSNPFTAIFDVIWSFPKYPELTYATYFRRNDDYLRRYDIVASQKRLLLTAGADAHSNKGYYLIADDEGNRHFGFKIDPYKVIFRLVRMHVLLESGKPLTRETLIEALRKGHAFVGFDILGDTSGFAFSADNGTEIRIMGGEIPLADGVKLNIVAPLKCRFVVYRNGVRLNESTVSNEYRIEVNEQGTYRVEAYLDDLGSPFDQAPWIVSNPIYVR